MTGSTGPADPLVWGLSCWPGGTTTSAWAQNNTTTEFIPVKAFMTNIFGANCGTASGGPQSATEGPVITSTTKGTGTARNLCCWLATAPGVGNTNVYTLRQNLASPSSGLVTSIGGTNTSACDQVHTVAIATGDLLDIQRTATGPPTLSQAGGCTFQIDY